MVTTGLLLALVLFVFVQAASVRGTAQSAADAAALAAAQEARDQLLDRFAEGLAEEGADLGDILDGDDFAAERPCAAAARLAELNDATVDDCARAEGGGGAGFTVRVESRDSVGDSWIPGTENQTAFADATAVLEGRCELSEEEGETGGEDGGETDGQDGGGDGGDTDGQDGGEDQGAGGEEEPEEERDPVRLDCDGDEEWTVDPGEGDDALPEARDLFRVYLLD
jgi:hypothetical protein